MSHLHGVVAERRELVLQSFAGRKASAYEVVGELACDSGPSETPVCTDVLDVSTDELPEGPGLGASGLVDGGSAPERVSVELTDALEDSLVAPEVVSAVAVPEGKSHPPRVAAAAAQESFLTRGRRRRG